MFRYLIVLVFILVACGSDRDKKTESQDKQIKAQQEAAKKAREERNAKIKSAADKRKAKNEKSQQEAEEKMAWHGMLLVSNPSLKDEEEIIDIEGSEFCALKGDERNPCILGVLRKNGTVDGDEVDTPVDTKEAKYVDYSQRMSSEGENELRSLVSYRYDSHNKNYLHRNNPYRYLNVAQIGCDDLDALSSRTKYDLEKLEELELEDEEKEAANNLKAINNMLIDAKKVGTSVKEIKGKIKSVRKNESKYTSKVGSYNEAVVRAQTLIVCELNPSWRNVRLVADQIIFRNLDYSLLNANSSSSFLKVYADNLFLIGDNYLKSSGYKSGQKVGVAPIIYLEVAKDFSKHHNSGAFEGSLKIEVKGSHIKK